MPKRLESVRDAMGEYVAGVFDKKRAEGKISLVHDIDHVKAVSTYGGSAAAYFAGQASPVNIDDIKVLAEITGLGHDIVREAKETEPHGPAGSKEIMRLYGEGGFLKELTPAEVDVVCSIVENHEKSFQDMAELFPQDYVKTAIGKGIAVGDKLIEASGPRVLERRSFFVGKERMQKDVNMFKYPDESYLAVLGETLIRLYDINRADNYPAELSVVVDFLHSTQYELLGGLLQKSGMDEAEAVEFMVKKGFPKIEKVAQRVKEERHLDGKYMDSSRFPKITTAIRNVGDDPLLGESAGRLVMEIATSKTPSEAIEAYRSGVIEGPPAYRRWVDGMLSYRSGKFRDVFEGALGGR